MRLYCCLSPRFTIHPVISHLTRTPAMYIKFGCVLPQKQPDKTVNLIGYLSRSLTDAKRRSNTKKGECLAIMWAVLQLRRYLENSRFTITTDRDSLKWILNLTNSTGRLAKCHVRLFEYELDIVHFAGIKL